MKKKILGSLMVIAAVFAFGMPEVFAAEANAYAFADWNAGGFGTATEVSDTVINFKGNVTATEGMFYGPYTKVNSQNLVDGILEELNVGLKAADFNNGEFFDLSVSLDDTDKNYVTEFRTFTQKVGDKFVVTTSFDKDFKVEVATDGVYTYRYEANLKDGKVVAKFTLLFYGEEVASTKEIDLDTITVPENKPVADKAVSRRSVWFDSINVAKGINVYSELPYATLTLSAEGEEQEVSVPYGSVLTKEEVQTIIDEVNAELKDTGYVFKGFYSDVDFKVEYDFTKPIVQDATLYIKLEKEVSNKEEEKIDNPNTSDIGLVGIITTIVLAGAGLGYTIKKRKFN